MRKPYQGANDEVPVWFTSETGLPGAQASLRSEAVQMLHTVAAVCDDNAFLHSAMFIHRVELMHTNARKQSCSEITILLS